MTPQEQDNLLIEQLKAKKKESWIIKQLKRLDFWLGEKFFGRKKDVFGAASFKGDLQIKVIRANPTLKTKISDYLRGIN